MRFRSVLTPRLWLVGIACSAALGVRAATDYPIQPVPFTAVRITGGFWAAKQEINRTVTVPFALDQCEESGRLKNFDLAAEVLRRRAAGEKNYQVTPPTIYPFDDTDAYKAIEGASYVLSMRPDPALAARLDGWIARIAAAQEPDGYLYTFRTMHPNSPGHKWIGVARWEKDPDLSHELYNAGHLYEAGVAHFRATGQRTLLEVCLRNAELLWRDFGDGRRRLAPGHQIVELGLVKLYRVTGDERWLRLAHTFLEARGPGGKAYSQQHLPVAEQTEAVGHAVRANYQYSGMADVAALGGDPRYQAAIERIWQNVVGRKLYLTGATGALAKGEAYGADYELPHDGYNETCASLALMMWAHRMFLLSGDGRYMDVFERTAFNGFLSGVSLSGDRFFYPNPLCYDGAAKNNHGHAGRAPWFGCACCPPNLMRTLASLGGYFYGVREQALYVNFYATSEGAATVAGVPVRLAQATRYPWDGRVALTLTPERPVEFELRLRVPGWARGEVVPSDLYHYDDAVRPHWTVSVNGQRQRVEFADGYAVLRRTWQPGDRVDLEFPLPVRLVRGHEQIAATRGQVALERGPLVYCVEAVDGPLPAGFPAGPIQFGVREEPALLGGVTTIEVSGAHGEQFTAIPYFAWANRGLHPMTVWLRRE